MAFHILNASNSGCKQLLVIGLMNIVCANTIKSIWKMLQLLRPSTVIRGVFVIHLPKTLKNLLTSSCARENPTSIPVKTRATDLPFEHPAKELDSATNETMTKVAKTADRVKDQFDD